MRIDALGGTDIGQIVLFWPAHLPADADQRLPRQEAALIDEQVRAGKLIQFPCPGDGSYKVAILVDEPATGELAQHFGDEVDLGELHVPEGTGFFGGVEGMHKDPEELPPSARAACSAVELPAGRYRARLSEFDPPELHEEDWIAAAAGPLGRKIASLRDSVGCLAAVAFLAGVAVAVWRGIDPWPLGMVVGALVLVLVNRRLTKTQGYRRLQAARAAYEEEFATYALVLERVRSA